MISIERDRHGRTYQIWKQQQANSCGIASCWMARGIAMQMSFAQEEWDYAVSVFASAIGSTLAGIGDGSGGMTLASSAFQTDDGTLASGMASFGFYMSQLALSLESEGLRTQNFFNNNNPTTIAHNQIAINKPAIALVLWDNGGGHFVVVGRCTSQQVSFLDPWDGHVNHEPNDGRYRARYGGNGTIVEVLYVRA